jgi:predicted homoserine dehydrogenase-like protein
MAFHEAAAHSRFVATDDAMLLARSAYVDGLLNVTGSVELGAQVALEAYRHGMMAWICVENDVCDTR